MLKTIQCTYIWNIICCSGRILGDLMKQAEGALALTGALPVLLDTCNQDFIQKNKDLKCISGMNLS